MTRLWGATRRSATVSVPRKHAMTMNATGTKMPRRTHSNPDTCLKGSMPDYSSFVGGKTSIRYRTLYERDGKTEGAGDSHGVFCKAAERRLSWTPRPGRPADL